MSCYSETSVDFQRSIRLYIGKDDGQTVMMKATGEILQLFVANEQKLYVRTSSRRESFIQTKFLAYCDY
jgi:hypothetical protein